MTNQHTKENLISAAEQGDAKAQFNLGNLYRIGEPGIPINEAKAIYWYEKSAEQGVIDAQFALGLLYQDSVENNDIQKSLYWYEKAAKQGNAGAQNNLGIIYKDMAEYKNAEYWYRQAIGNGSEIAEGNLKSLKELEIKRSELELEELELKATEPPLDIGFGGGLCLAVICVAIYVFFNGLYQESRYPTIVQEAQAGDRHAQVELGDIHTRDGEKFDVHEAIYWYEKAAKQGHVKSQFDLGIIYKDMAEYKKATYWLRQAMKNGHKEAKRQLGWAKSELGYAKYIKKRTRQ